ncbi:3-hydroxybutyrate oligomer hydrolase family protein [Thalassolituus sp. LLYu03]|uniref:3-hydroxybutyrate oligomer hydrolase family protein n=1 Tax=Thalassolituus sp. LLYu03 TaxID=3421656 RepID=UPI003D2685C2
MFARHTLRTGILNAANRPTARALPLAAALLLAACGGDDNALNTRPDFIVSDVTAVQYDGISDDLLTAGLGVSGLQGSAPAYADAEHPTAAELRRKAIYNNYRALLDTTTEGGFGRLYGPNIHAGAEQSHGGKIAGKEYVFYTDSGDNVQHNVTVAVQIPATFSAENACIVVGAASGSRGVYGAIGTASEWGLNQGCAVALTDKGTGNGAHDIDSDTVTLIDGTLALASDAGSASHFTASDSGLDDFSADYPHRVAYKHAHSQTNPEKDWGLFVLQAAEAALYVLNLPENAGRENDAGKNLKTLTRKNTLIIAASVSNGGGASLRAAELDDSGLIDAVVASEPNVQPDADLTTGYSVQQGNLSWDHLGRNLFDYTTLLSVLQPCASVGADAAAVGAGSSARCQALKAAGLLSGDDDAALAADAQQQLRDYGLVPEQDFTQHANSTIKVPQSIAVTYANAYGRFGVTDNLCDFSLAFGPAMPTAATTTQMADLFASGNGIPPSAGVVLINNQTGTEDRSSTADQNLDGHLCLRDLALGDDATDQTRAQRLATGIAEVSADPRKLKVPAVIVHGRADAIIPINHSSRPYFAINHNEGTNKGSDLRYVEVLNAHHLDLLNGLFAGYKTRYVGLHYYFGQALDQMYAHLRDGSPLPGNQVIATTPRSDASAQLTAASLPAMQPADSVSSDCLIQLDGKALTVPETCGSSEI